MIFNVNNNSIIMNDYNILLINRLNLTRQECNTQHIIYSKNWTQNMTKLDHTI